MPTYEFRCPDGTIIERFYKISEAPDEIPSPNGDGVAVRIISGGAGLLFKGSGFYITDYGKDGKKDQRAASDKAGTGGEAKSADSGSSGATGGTSSSSAAAGSGGASAAAPAPAPKSESKSDSKSDK